MFNFIINKISSYLIFLAFSVVVISTVSFVIQEQKSKVASIASPPQVCVSPHKSIDDLSVNNVFLHSEINGKVIFSGRESGVDNPLQVYKSAAITKTPTTEKHDNIIRISNFPVKGGHLTSGFGMRNDPIHGAKKMHSGVDIAAVSGTFVYPMGKGKVIFSGVRSGYGNVIEIRHGRTVVSRYAHLAELLIEVGREVNKDDIIGLVGETGRVTGPHLHLELTLNQKIVDPQIFLIGDIATR